MPASAFLLNVGYDGTPRWVVLLRGVKRPLNNGMEIQPGVSISHQKPDFSTFRVNQPPNRMDTASMAENGCCCFVAVFSAFWRVFVRFAAQWVFSLYRL
jgi:hypothetical protein